MVKFIQEELKKPEYRDDVEKAIRDVCNVVPRSDKDKCLAFVEQYEKQLIDLLTNDADPEVVCELLDICYERRYPITHNELCPICQYVMHFLEDELNDPAEQEDIARAVTKVCQLVPQKEAEECTKFVSEYSALIITVLSKELDPSMVCPALKVCPSLRSPATRCQHCVHLVQNLVDGLAGDRLEDRIESQLQHFVPPTRNEMTPEALELYASHHEDIVDMMVAEFNAPQSCVFLRFCAPDMVVHSVQNAFSLETNEVMTDSKAQEIADELMGDEKEVAKTSCELCQLMVRLYEDKLTTNATEEELEDVLMKYCKKIQDHEISSNCTRFVLKYVPVLVDLLKKDVKPKDLCGLAKLCHLQPVNTFSIETTEKCRLCEAIVGSLQSMAADPYVVDNVVREVEKICDLFGEKNRETCAQIVVGVGPQLDSIVLGIPSWFYCSKMDMCPYREHLIDRSVCQNESTWCQDKRTAILCDKLEYCQDRVWKSDSPSR